MALAVQSTIPDGYIADFIDGKHRKDTPEEYVRQQMERRLVLELGYLREQIAVELPIKVGSSTKRVDLAVFDLGAAHVQSNIKLVVECKKKSTTKPSDKAEGVGQLESYMAASLAAEWGLWFNGVNKEVRRRIASSHGHAFENHYNDVPGADGNVAAIDRPERAKLLTATDDGLALAFRSVHDFIYAEEGLQKQPAFFELLKIIFCKIEDERAISKPVEFFATAKEKAAFDGRSTVAKRIEGLFERVKSKPANKPIFASGTTIDLKPKTVAYIVGELQRYAFLKTNVDVKGKAYEEIVGANLRGDRGEFFTPRNIQHMAVRMLDLGLEDKILDPACGTGGFLVTALAERIKRIRADLKNQNLFTESEAKDRLDEAARACFFGFDLNPDLVKATKMNMVMNNDGSGNILPANSLLPPHQWEADFKAKLSEALGLSPMEFRRPIDLAQFDAVAANPPFGTKIRITGADVLEQYDLGHVWTKPVKRSDPWTKTDALHESQPPELLFLERLVQFLKPGGRMAVVLPDGILGNPDLAYVRQWLLSQGRLVASIDLHPDAFQPRNGTQTSVLVFQKWGPNNPVQLDYPIFMAQQAACGHDKRGNITYWRDSHGEIILVDGEPDERGVVGKVRVIDDDSVGIADVFLTWKKEAVLGW